MTFASDVKIFGTLTIADKLNGFNLGKMCELLEPQPDVPPQKLTIKGVATDFIFPFSTNKLNFVFVFSFVNFFLGDVIFNASPTTEYLNSEPFEHMRLTTWMANDQYVNFTSDVQFENVIFEKSITTTVKMNRKIDGFHSRLSRINL